MKPRTAAVLASLLLLAIVSFVELSASESEGMDEAIIAATQARDIEEVRRLLASGADVNAKTRYGATPLFFACDKGDKALVELLLDAGADPNITDTFYQANPLSWSAFQAADSDPHREIVVLLLQRGAHDVTAALTLGARTGDATLVEAALATGRAAAQDLRSAASVARTAGQTEVEALLQAALPTDAEEEVGPELSAEQLERFVGSFRNDELGLALTIFFDGGELMARAGDQPALVLAATTPTRFSAPEAGLDIEFGGRGGLIEQFVLRRGGQEAVFRKFDPSEPGEDAIADTPPAAPIEVTRTKPAPWPAFRGTRRAGNGDGQGVPSEWSAATDTNILWKTPLAGIATSSPITWGNRVFVTTAQTTTGDTTFRTGLYGDVDSVEDDSVHRWMVYALDKATGTVVWERVAHEGVPSVKRHLKSSQANPTPVTDGEYLVASFGSEGLYCYRLDGELVWSRDLGRLSSGWFYDPTYEWGFASSPILFEKTAIVQVDIHGDSFVAAYDLETGDERWRTVREEIPTWGTPTVLVGGDVPEVVTNGTTVRGYNARTGEELWRLGPNSEITVASPIVGGGMAYVTGGYPPVRPIYAIRPGQRGDLSLAEGETSSSAVAWSSSGGTYIPTPIHYDGVLYVLHNNGRLAAYEADTGNLIYRERVGRAESYSASPVAADGRLFFTTEEGRTYVVRAGRTFEVLATNDLGEVVMSTPAISDGAMIIRGLDHVYSIGAAPLDDPAP